MSKPEVISLPLPVLMLSGGTAASIAEAFTIPFDTGKVRLQIQGEGKDIKYKGMIHCLKTVAKEEGPLALWSGLSAGIQRQYVFASLRLGMFDPVKDYISNGKDATLGIRIATGLITGTIAMLIASPTDLVKVRLQAQGKFKLTDPSKIRYNGLFHAYSRIFAEEGLRGFWTGVGPNCVRNAVINAAELATFDQVKTTLLKKDLMKDNLACQFVSSAIAGGVACIIGSPVDVVKTRIMNQDAKSPTRYTGVLNCISRTFKEEGFFAFYKGLKANASRIISWNICMFVVWGELKKSIYHNYYKKNE